MQSPIAVTGIGVVSPLGSGYRNFADSVLHNRSGIKEISVFDTTPYPIKIAGEIDGFEPERYLPKKGLRSMDRSTRFICAAALMALQDAQIAVQENNKHRIGVITGTTFGSLKSISDFDIESLSSESPLWVNPMDFPKTTINAPSSNVSILTGIMGYNTTISGGFTSSLEAISHSIDLLLRKRLDIVLACSVEDLSLQNYLYHCALQKIADDGLKTSIPFAGKSEGYLFGEGSVVFVLERLEDVENENRRSYATITGLGQGFNIGANSSPYNFPQKTLICDVLKQTLESAGMTSGDIKMVSSCANGWSQYDTAEAQALAEVFKTDPAITAIKSLTGETASAGGGFSLLQAIVSFREQVIPPISGLDNPLVPLNYVINEKKMMGVNNALVTSSDPGGSYMGLIILK